MPSSIPQRNGAPTLLSSVPTAARDYAGSCSAALPKASCATPTVQSWSYAPKRAQGISMPPPQNLLLAHLPREVFHRIEPDLKLISLPHGQVVHRAGEEIQDLYFPLTCM